MKSELTKSEDPLGLARVSVESNGRIKLGLDYPDPGTDLCKLPMPWIAGQAISLTGFQAVGFTHMRTDDADNKSQTITFFIDDKRVERVATRPWAYVARLGQYRQTLAGKDQEHWIGG